MSTIFTSWFPSMDVAVGDFLETPASLAIPVGLVATVAGQTGTTEPDWTGGHAPPLDGLTVIDGGVTWTIAEPTWLDWEAVPLYKTGLVEPAWNTVVGGTTVHNGITFTTRTPAITDEKCPHHPLAISMSQKIFSPKGDVVRYSATDNPRDWSSELDAGFLPTGMHATQSQETTALEEYRGRLVVLTNSNLQLWTTDPDPSEMSLFDNITGVGTRFAHAHTPVADDLYFTTELGVRRLSIAAGATNLATYDIGTGIDELVRALLDGPDEPIATYYPGLGQFWLAFGNEVFVFSRSNITTRVGGWSRYQFPFTITDFAQGEGKLFIRHGTQGIHYVDESIAEDDGWGQLAGSIMWPYLDLGSPTVTKMLYSLDIVGTGPGSISIGYDQDDATKAAGPMSFGGDTVPSSRIPFALSAASFQIRLTYEGPGPWQFNGMALMLADMSPETS